MIDARDRRLLAVLQDGLPFVERPYAAVGARIGMPEDDVIARLRALLADGVIRRFGLVVRHRELGYDANAMAVWDVPDDRVDEAGQRIAGIDFVTLCYRRPRRPPDWPYNLFCMIHGRDRDTVRAQVRIVTGIAGLEARPHAILFSKRRFKQRGAIFSAAPAEAT